MSLYRIYVNKIIIIFIQRMMITQNNHRIKIKWQIYYRNPLKTTSVKLKWMNRKSIIIFIIHLRDIKTDSEYDEFGEKEL